MVHPHYFKDQHKNNHQINICKSYGMYNYITQKISMDDISNFTKRLGFILTNDIQNFW